MAPGGRQGAVVARRWSPAGYRRPAWRPRRGSDQPAGALRVDPRRFRLGRGGRVQSMGGSPTLRKARQSTTSTSILTVAGGGDRHSSRWRWSLGLGGAPTGARRESPAVLNQARKRGWPWAGTPCQVPPRFAQAPSPSIAVVDSRTDPDIPASMPAAAASGERSLPSWAKRSAVRRSSKATPFPSVRTRPLRNIGTKSHAKDGPAPRG